MKSSPCQRGDDGVGDTSDVEPIGQSGGGLPACFAGIGEDGYAVDAVRPLPAAQSIRRQGGPGRNAEDRRCRERGLNSLGDADMTIVAYG